jgi:hypothetical protein
MNAFIVELPNQPGEMARITEAIATKGIDLTGFSGVTGGGTGTVAILTNDEAGTRKVLREIGAQTREIEVVPAAIENKPGSLATAARRLADAGVNIEAVMAIGMSGDKVNVAFATSDATAARAALGGSVLAAATGR